MLFQIVSRILIYVPLLIIFILLIDLLYHLFVIKVGNVPEIIIRYATAEFFLIILMFIGDWFDSLSNKIDSEIETGLIGYLLSATFPVHVGKISEILDISEKTVMSKFFKLKSDGKLEEFTFDSDRREITPPTLTPGSPFTTTPQALTSITEELLTKAKLKELEKLRKEGKISQEAYEELKKEIIERKS